MKILGLLVPTFFCALSFAGRPVYHDLDLKDLLGRSGWVLSVKNLRSKKVKLKCGWDSELYVVEVVKVLRSSQERQFKPTQTIEFAPSPTAIADCEHRQKHSSGVSFAAVRYKSSLDFSKLRKSESFVVFLTVANGQLSLVADGAFEKPSVVEAQIK